MTVNEKNLVFWRSLVGLEPSFPSLPPLRDEELLPLAVLDASQLEAIRSSLGTHQLTQIVVEPGWGCTTLFRYLVKEARDNVMGRLLLPIALDLGSLFGQGQREPLGRERLELEIKRQIIGLLVDSPWEQSLNHDYYFECINYDSSIDLPNYRARMRLLMSDRPPPPRKLFTQFPWLRNQLSDCLNYLLANLRIQTVLYFHFPRGVESQQVRDLISAVKATIYESGAVDFAAWREVYFCSPRQRPEIGRDFQRHFNVVHYPRYTAAQIYMMLVKRYTPNVPGFRGRNPVSLNSVFAEDFVKDARRGAASLANVIEKVYEDMLRRLDCPETDVPFELKPLEGEASPGEATPDQPTPIPVRRPFLRKRGVG